MTIAGLAPLLTGAEEIYVAWNGCIRKIHLDDELDMDAYGKYAISRIVAAREGSLELEIAAHFVTAEEVKA